MVKWATGIVVLPVAGALLFVAPAGAGSKPAPPCRVSAIPPQHVAPNGITATASLRCSRGQNRASLVVDLVVPASHGFRRYDRVPNRGTFGVVARQRAVLPAVQAGSPYRITAKTSKCVTYAYGTVAKLFVGGRRARLWLSRHSFIDCNSPADNRCEVVAHTPTMGGVDLLGSGSFTCVSDQQLAIYKVTLEELNDGSWQDDGMIEGGNDIKGGQTLTKTVHQPCANEGGPPWPKDFRTVAELQRARGPSISQTSATASLSCPSPPITLTVHLTGGGSGTVISSPAGIDCPQTCSHGFTYGSQVTLTAQPAAGSTFQGWVGGSGPPPGPCSGNGTCTITVDNTYGPPYVYADFEVAPSGY